MCVCVIVRTHFNPMARMKLMAATIKKRPRQISVEADIHHRNTGIREKLQRNSATQMNTQWSM